jgi:hypothetical protein
MLSGYFIVIADRVFSADFAGIVRKAKSPAGSVQTGLN